MDRFIVGTGRCGSTLLSRMLSQHPRVLSVFEFLNGLDMAERFRPDPVDGEFLVRLLGAEQPFVNAVLRRGYKVSEVVYPFGQPGVRYALGDPVPWLLVTMLPRISGAPDALFDALLAWAVVQPVRPLAQHYRGVFEWLCGRLDRDVWIERSGSSIEYLPSLCELYPDARILHLHRDGGEVALSMREHHAYRLPISLLYDVPLDDGVRVSELGEFDVYAAAEPEGRDPVSRILASHPPPAPFGRYWSDQVTRGLAAVAQIPADRYRVVRFEDLVAAPAEVLREITAFFELDEPSELDDPNETEGGTGKGWIERAAALVRGAPPTRFAKLAPGDQHALTEACREGRELLER